jgi:hypothetical protein
MVHRRGECVPVGVHDATLFRLGDRGILGEAGAEHAPAESASIMWPADPGSKSSDAWSRAVPRSVSRVIGYPSLEARMQLCLHWIFALGGMAGTAGGLFGLRRLTSTIAWNAYYQHLGVPVEVRREIALASGRAALRLHPPDTPRSVGAAEAQGLGRGLPQLIVADGEPADDGAADVIDDAVEDAVEDPVRSFVDLG